MAERCHSDPSATPNTKETVYLTNWTWDGSGNLGRISRIGGIGETVLAGPPVIDRPNGASDVHP